MIEETKLSLREFCIASFNFIRQFLQHYGLWLLRISIFAMLISLFVAPNVRVILENPPQSVDAVKDHVCVHTRLIDEVPEWVMQRSLQLVREMGADTIVEFFPVGIY